MCNLSRSRQRAANYGASSGRYVRPRHRTTYKHTVQDISRMTMTITRIIESPVHVSKNLGSSSLAVSRWHRSLSALALAITRRRRSLWPIHFPDQLFQLLNATPLPGRQVGLLFKAAQPLSRQRQHRPCLLSARSFML